ncbi:MAG: hypothetical protein OES24_23055, partial [Acidimicrobiia bacterium]|nr:hypothetical protein [Acidimicrobiia bacterium]
MVVRGGEPETDRWQDAGGDRCHEALCGCVGNILVLGAHGTRTPESSHTEHETHAHSAASSALRVSRSGMSNEHLSQVGQSAVDDEGPLDPSVFFGLFDDLVDDGDDEAKNDEAKNDEAKNNEAEQEITV